MKDEATQAVLGADARIALGRLQARQGREEEAEATLQEALARLASRDLSVVHKAQLHNALAELYESQDRWQEARHQLRTSLALRQRIAEADAKNVRTQLEIRAAMDAAKRDAEIHKLRYVELVEMQSKLVEAEKMALLGKLAAGTAHELNTPLGVLKSSAELSATASRRLVELLDAAPELAGKARRLTEAMASSRDTSDAAVGRIVEIVESLRRFTQLDEADQQRFDVREGLDSAWALLSSSVPAGVEVRRRFDDVPAVLGWPREAHHAFFTVLQNAVEAIEGEGIVTLDVRSADGAVEVQISDTGRGMSEEKVRTLFDVGLADRGPRARMRLGLSAAYATMKKHEGTVLVESKLDEGTTVSFRFPAAEA